MADLIETVARAICRPRCDGDFHPCDTDDGRTCKPEKCRHWHQYEESARDAIKAIDAAPGWAVMRVLEPSPALPQTEGA